MSVCLDVTVIENSRVLYSLSILVQGEIESFSLCDACNDLFLYL
jgi:hypothetical protein